VSQKIDHEEKRALKKAWKRKKHYVAYLRAYLHGDFKK
jgi:hypothetical protein